MKVLNKKVDEVYHQQKEKEARLYDTLMEKQRSMLLESVEINGNDHHTSVFGSHKSMDFRQSVENRKQLL